MSKIPLVIVLLFKLLVSKGQCSGNLSSTGALCFNDCNGTALVSPTGTYPFTYNWSTGDTTQSITGLCPGTYSITITDNLGCTSIDSITINTPTQLLATVTALSTPSNVGMCDAELTFSVSGGTPPYTIQWLECINDSIFWSPLMPPPPWYFCAGNWGIIATDANGCNDTSCVAVPDSVLTIQTYTYTKTLNYTYLDNTLFFSKPIENINLFDMLGHVILYLNKKQVKQINLPHLPEGIYIITATTFDGTLLNNKLIIIR